MPRIVHSEARVTITVDAINDDGSKFQLSRTVGAEYTAVNAGQRRILLDRMILEAARRFNETDYLETSQSITHRDLEK